MNDSRAEIVEICNRCGRSVSYGNGSFVNRVLDCNDVLTRIENHWPFPQGDFVCASCENKTSDDELMNLN
jgi:hypothetical protein